MSDKLLNNDSDIFQKTECDKLLLDENKDLKNQLNKIQAQNNVLHQRIIDLSNEIECLKAENDSLSVLHEADKDTKCKTIELSVDPLEMTTNLINGFWYALSTDNLIPTLRELIDYLAVYCKYNDPE